MGVGPNYGLNKGMLAQGSTAYAFGELVVPGTVEQSVVRATTAGAAGFVGVCQEDVDATRINTGKVFLGVAFGGIVRVITGAAVAKNSKLTNDTSARAIVQAGAVGSGAPVIGISLTASSAAGEYVDMLLTPGAAI